MPPQTNNTKLTRPRKGLKAALLVLFGVLLVLVLLAQEQAIYDWTRLHNYSPPAAIAQFTQDDQFTPTAQKVFYVNHPVIEDKITFASRCPNGGREAAVLGCYIPNQQGIYILQVTDPELSGIEQVTAAHELLHAEYDRLDSKTKAQVNNWLMQFYQQGLHDQNIIDQMNTYKKTEPSDLINEMHSVFGTEVANLPPNLEAYYKHYFTNRATITGYYSKYENQFSSRLNQIKQDDSQLAAWKSQINSLESDIQAKQAALTSSQQQLQSYRDAGNIAAYNSGVPGYNAQVTTYNAQVVRIHSLVDEYNQLVAERNAIALEEQQLVQDITSNVTPISK